MTANTSAPPGRDGLSSGAIGGIVGGILGAGFLISLAVIVFLLGRRRAAGEAPANLNIQGMTIEGVVAEKTDTGGRLEELGNTPATDSLELGGRLQYPDDNFSTGGRLGANH
jgi:hypothetical protein